GYPPHRRRCRRARSCGLRVARQRKPMQHPRGEFPGSGCVASCVLAGHWYPAALGRRRPMCMASSSHSQTDAAPKADDAPQSAAARVGRVVFGDRKDPLSPTIFHQISLMAFLAWVGLGADGLSSSCYGPEEAYLALGDERFLALFLVLAMTLTVLVISASYS